MENIFTGETIEKEYDTRTYLSSMYVFGEDVYLVLGFKETILDRIVNGYNEVYIVHEKND